MGGIYVTCLFWAGQWPKSAAALWIGKHEHV